MSPFPYHLAIIAFTLAITSAVNSRPSNSVAITPQSYSNGNHVNVIKSEPQADEEYITSFYKRVREKHRANFGRQLESHGHSSQADHKGDNLQQHQEDGSDSLHQYYHEDHSLDHYFDHQLSSSHDNKQHNHPRYKKPVLRAAEVTSTSSSPSDAARSVRGGGVGAGRKLVHKPSFVAKAKQNIWSPREGGNTYESRSYDHAGGGQSNHYHQHSFEDEDMMSDSDEDYDDYYDYDDEEDLQSFTHDYGDDNEGEDDFPPNEHHLGLLRVPCSIAVNSGEATHHYDSSSSHDGTYVVSSNTVVYIHSFHSHSNLIQILLI